jgi:hypothetical protein
MDMYQSHASRVALFDCFLCDSARAQHDPFKLGQAGIELFGQIERRAVFTYKAKSTPASVPFPLIVLLRGLGTCLAFACTRKRGKSTKCHVMQSRETVADPFNSFVIDGTYQRRL